MHPGDQHLPANDKSGQPNPFTAQQPSITRMSAQEIATLQAKLDRQLGPEYISDRPGAGGTKVQYLEAWKCINLANEIFGFNGWSSSIQNIAIDYMDENRESGRVSLGLSVVVRVTLRDGDIGYGSIDNAKSKAAAFEKCKKEGTTDGLKRALRNFGNVLGNCLYDKSYLREVSKIKLPTPRFDVQELHRRPEFALTPKAVPSAKVPSDKQSRTAISTAKPPDVPMPICPERNAMSDEAVFQDQFDDDYFDDYDFEDRPVLVESPRLNEFDTNTLPSIPPPPFNLPPTTNVGSSAPPTSLQTTPPQQGNPIHSAQPQNPLRILPQPRSALALPPTIPQNGAFDTHQPNHPQPPNTTPQNPPVQQQPFEPPGQTPQPAVGFNRITKDGSVLSPFDPKAVNSPLGRISTGVDPNKSTPIPRSKVTKVPLANNYDVHNRMGQVPQMGPVGRKVGCPPSGHASPGKIGLHARATSGPSLTGAKRNSQGQLIGHTANGRPLGDISGQTSNQGAQGMQAVHGQPDLKRFKN